MGKKKHHGKHHRHDRPEPRFEVPPEVAGLAAMALRQVDTPAFRQLMAGALGAAAQAFDQRRPAAAPVPPVPPVPPVEAAPRPAGENPEVRLPPEAAQAIEQAARQLGQAIESAATLAARAVETAAEGLARWTEQQRGRAAEDGERPHG